MSSMDDVVRRLAVLFLLTCLRSSCTDGIVIRSFKNVGTSYGVRDMFLVQLNRTDKLQCCLKCLEKPWCLQLGVSPHGKCLLLGGHVEETRNQSLITEDVYILYEKGGKTPHAESKDEITVSSSHEENGGKTPHAESKDEVTVSSSHEENGGKTPHAESKDEVTVSSSHEENGGKTPHAESKDEVTVSSSHEALSGEVICTCEEGLSIFNTTFSKFNLLNKFGCHLKIRCLRWTTDKCSMTADDGKKRTPAKMCKEDEHENVDELKHSSSHKDPSNEMGDAFVESKYTVFTQTGTEKGSGTQSLVYLHLTGDDFTIALYLNNIKDEMQLGQNDTFLFTSHCSIGKITGMVMKASKYLLEAGWLCVGMEVRRELKFTRYTEVEVFLISIHRRFCEDWTFFDEEELSFKRTESYRKDF